MNIAAAEKITGFMEIPELEWLAEQASQANLIIEIGSHKGRSTRALADNTLGQVIAVDMWSAADTIFEEFNTNLLDHLLSEKVKVMRMSSLEAAHILQVHKTIADFTFIDASHDYNSVRADIDAYRLISRKLSGHDYNSDHPDVGRALIDTFAFTNPVGGIWLRS